MHARVHRRADLASFASREVLRYLAPKTLPSSRLSKT